MTRSQSPVVANLKWALKGAYSFAAIYCVWVLGVYFIRGDEPFRQIGVSFLGVELFYLAAAGAAGAVVGLLRPLMRWVVGAYFVGYIAGFILSASCTLLVSGNPAHWGYRELFVICVAGVLGGSVIGRQLRKSGYPDSVAGDHKDSEQRGLLRRDKGIGI